MNRPNTQLLLLLAWLCAPVALAQDGTVTRVLPVSAYHPGQALTLTVQAAPVASTIIYAVEEDAPAGWTVDVVSHSGRFNAARRKITWGPFFDNLGRSLTVQMTPPSDAGGRVTFSGYGSFNGTEVATGGPSELDSALLGGGSVTRSLPLIYRPGLTVTVTLNAAPTAAVYLQMVEESYPAGWEVVAVSDGGAQSASAGSLKWGPFMDADPRALTYTLRAPTGAVDSVQFSGRAVFNSAIVPVTGDAALPPAPRPSGLVARLLPASYVPGQEVAALIQVIPDAGVAVYAVEETVPAGWTASGMSEGGCGLTKTGLGVLVLGGANTYSGPTVVNQGRLLVSGSLAASVVTVNNGGSVSGSGSMEGLILNAGATLAPGTSPGTLTADDSTWGPGATYEWEINKAYGTKGADPGWDWLSVSGTLDLTATAENRFNINVIGLKLDGTPGAVNGFNNAYTYSWTIASAGAAITGLDAAKFNLDVSSFVNHNPLGSGTFSIARNGNHINVVFTPEPGQLAFVAGCGLLAWAAARGRRIIRRKRR